MSSASIVGIAILESPVTVAGHPTTLHFDAQFWLGFDKPVLSASLQYYNGNGLTFEDGGEYFVYANISRGLAKTPTPSPNFESKDYHFVGDIIWLIPTNLSTNPQPPWLIVTGTATDVNEKAATFNVNAHQYTHALATDWKQSSLPVHAHIPDSHRYAKKKPIPNNNSYVAIVGFLSDVELEKNGTPSTAKHFLMDIDNVTFLGKPGAQHPSASDTPVPVNAPRHGNNKFKHGFINFRSDVPSAAPTSSPPHVQPPPPSDESNTVHTPPSGLSPLRSVTASPIHADVEEEEHTVEDNGLEYAEPETSTQGTHKRRANTKAAAGSPSIKRVRK